jgi:signal transduction histidine kinase
MERKTNVLQVHPESTFDMPSLLRLKLISADIPTKNTEDTRRDSCTTERDLRDVNQELLLAGLAAQDQRSAAESALQRQLKALTILAHEMRNGLTPIQAASDLLGRAHTIDAPLLTRLQAVIHRNSAHLSRLIEDLLDGSRANTGEFRLERRLVDLSDIVRQAVASCLPAMELRSQKLTVSAPLDGLFIDADPDRIRQILVNLLDNACKFTPVGGSIVVTALSRAGNVEVSVCDNGIGIGSDTLPHIFDLFAQGPQQYPDTLRGLGVGLAVAQELVQSHGGTITAESAGPAHGSQFTATFPCHAPIADTAP